MRVKRLEIFGFKSFANKTTIRFEPGVTAIVGPNGSGKSNVVDSIRWVLGETNPRDVRAPRLEDVIFSGTDTKAPLSMAEVHLTIDNSSGLMPISFTEVTITRRVYRSGESECFINNAPCRLKDIRELFMGTGLGGGTYAIIEQGHIDMVLSSKPEERRVVFEEASGVAKYLQKKNEALRRLEETEEHLVRIADIAGEVKRQVSALERQANKARQYKTQWDELKSLELRLAADELRQGAARFGALEQQLEALNATRQGMEGQRQGHVSAIEACNAEVSAIQQRVQALRTAAVECASTISQHESQVGIKSRWIEELAGHGKQLEHEQAQIQARLAALGEQLARAGGADAEVRAQLTGFAAQLASGAEALAALEATAQACLATLQMAKAEVFDAASEATQQRNAGNAATSRLQSLDAQLGRIDGQRTQLAQRAQDVTARRDAAVQEQHALRGQAEEIQRRLAETQGALDAAQARRHELAGRLHQMREQLARAKAGAQLAEDLWRRYEGFPDAVKTLMGQSIPGLLGALVDLVQAAPGYEGIVESALGPMADALVVRDREALMRCRETLTAQQLEGVRFIVLSDCPTHTAPMEQPSSVAVSGAVKQYVQTSPAYQPLVDWLLNDSWVVDDLHRMMHDPLVPQGRLVNREGDRWDRRSWRFTGSQRSTQGRIGRRQRWEQSGAEVARLDAEFAQLDADASQAEQSWQSLLGQQETAKGELAQVSPGMHKLEGQTHQLDREAQRIRDEQAALELETQELTVQREQSRALLAAAQQAAEAAQARQQSLEQALTAAQAARESADAQRQQLLLSRAQLEMSHQALQERAAALASRRQELDAEQSSLTQQLDAKSRQRDDAVRRSQELTQQIEEHRQGIGSAGGERARLDDEAGQVEASLREAETRRDQELPHLLALEQELAAVANTIAQQHQQLSERGFRRQRITERLRELYQIDEATLDADVKAEASPLGDEQRGQMSEQAQKLRSKLEGLGPVSLGSVEEYDELKRRHEFLQTQQNDLVKARDDLKASIAQINRTARVQFRETFEKIRQEFQHYYTRLFNGGQADVILMDEEDVLSCGIDIVARPPGKRLQSISLLSGGERALTAIALLFALFKVKPSPFCILDEIDAPLDEANVDRFTRVLEEFLALSQFILITHNKKTITKADSLYGVTMQEAGVSKILSAKLDSASPAPAPAEEAPAAAS